MGGAFLPGARIAICIGKQMISCVFICIHIYLTHYSFSVPNAGIVAKVCLHDDSISAMTTDDR